MWRTQFYCKKCNDAWDKYMAGDEKALADDIEMPPKAWDKKSWEGGSDSWKQPEQEPPSCSEIDFSEAEMRQASALIPDRTVQKPASSSSKAGVTTLVGRIVERCSGVDGSDPSSPLASIESLKLIAVVSTIRRELGLALATGDVARCATLQDLEDMCEEVRSKRQGATQKVVKEADDGSGDWAVMAIPRFFKAPVGWLIRLDEVPQERAMHAAACALVRRHPGLRALPYRKGGDEFLAEMSNRAAPIVLVLRTLLGEYAKGFVSKASDCVVSAWPRLTVEPATSGPTAAEPGPEVAHFHWLRFSTMAELRHAAFMRARSRGFKTPAQICVLVLAGSGGASANSPLSKFNGSRSHDVAYLHVAVNHAVCDAFCIVPLMADLLALHDAAVQAEVADEPLMSSPCKKARLDEAAKTAKLQVSYGAAGKLSLAYRGQSIGAPPVARDLGVLADMAAEIAALPRAPNGLALQQDRLRSALDPESVKPDAQDITHGTFAPRRRGYDHYVRMKHGAVTLLQAGSAIIGVPPDHLLVTITAAAFACISGQEEVKLSLIVPMRDGTGEGSCLGNLATTRHMSVWFGKRSLLSVALDLSQRLRRREWELNDLIGDDGDRLFINVRDIPKFEGATSVMEDVDTKRATTRFVRNVMEMFVDKEKETSWAFIIGIRDDLSGDRFGQALRKTLWSIATEPLGPAIPSLPPPIEQAVAVAAEKEKKGWPAAGCRSS